MNEIWPAADDQPKDGASLATGIVVAHTLALGGVLGRAVLRGPGAFGLRGKGSLGGLGEQAHRGTQVLRLGPLRDVPVAFLLVVLEIYAEERLDDPPSRQALPPR